MSMDNMDILDNEIPISRFMIDETSKDIKIFIQVLTIFNDNEGVIQTSTIKEGKISSKVSHENLSELINKENIIQVTKDNYILKLIETVRGIEDSQIPIFK